MKLKNKKLIKKIIIILSSVFMLSLLIAISINLLVVLTTKEQIISKQTASELDDVDCILVLGCYVRPDGSPSHMLSDRIDMGIELYQANAAPKILMSGDHGKVNYDEVAAMKTQATNAGVPSCDVFLDHAGFSTYESIYRAKEIFGAKKIIIVTQEYHLYRALFIADKLGVEAYGVSSDYRSYGGQTMRDIREFAARIKDFATTVIKPKPTYLGEKIPLNGDGDITND